MNRKAVQIIFPIIIAITIFSLWAGFALLVVNRYLYRDLPGYTIGKICIWEFIALLISAFLSYLIVRSWGNIDIGYVENKIKLVLNPKYGIYFLLYFIIAILVGIWQFLLFSQGF